MTGLLRNVGLRTLGADVGSGFLTSAHAPCLPGPARWEGGGASAGGPAERGWRCRVRLLDDAPHECSDDGCRASHLGLQLSVPVREQACQRQVPGTSGALVPTWLSPMPFGHGPRSPVPAAASVAGHAPSLRRDRRSVTQLAVRRTGADAISRKWLATFNNPDHAVLDERALIPLFPSSVAREGRGGDGGQMPDR